MGSTRTLLGVACAIAMTSCGGSNSALPSVDASAGVDATVGGDAGADAGISPLLDGNFIDGGTDGGPATFDCTYADGGATLDASSRFQGSCASGCPAGTICAVEIGGVAGGGGEYCAPIVDSCVARAAGCGVRAGKPAQNVERLRRGAG